MGKRFKDNGDGTVTDNEEGLMWKQTDGFQDQSMFHTWLKAEDYIRELNNKKFAGYNDWHMPNLEEAESLFGEDSSIRDCDRFEIFIDSAFSPGGGYTTWTSSLKPHNGADEPKILTGPEPGATARARTTRAAESAPRNRDLDGAGRST